MTRPFPDLQNPLKEKLNRGDAVQGIFFLSGSPALAEACSTTSLDWIAFDCEAGFFSKDSLLTLMQSVKTAQTAAFVRVPWNDRHHIEYSLDLGADGIIVPKVDSALEAQSAVEAALFPPHGKRGLNPVRASGYFSDVAAYIKQANDKTQIFVQIESIAAVDNIEAIINVAGLDGVFIGCGDLALALGVPGNMDAPSMQQAIHKVLQATIAAGKIPGIFAYSLPLARQYICLGFQFVAIGNDVKFLKQSIHDSLAAVRFDAVE